jgi:hypothetical protein
MGASMPAPMYGRPFGLKAAYAQIRYGPNPASPGCAVHAARFTPGRPPGRGADAGPDWTARAKYHRPGPASPLTI